MNYETLWHRMRLLAKGRCMASPSGSLVQRQSSACSGFHRNPMSPHFLSLILKNQTAGSWSSLHFLFDTS